jgi:two-component system heavy metal sensor histidine kinase CusS
MVSDMLWIARSDKGLISANKEFLDSENELSSILDFFMYLAEEKALRLTLQILISLYLLTK